METKYALVLTGSTLPGFAPETVWPALAAYFRMEPAKLTDQVLVRAPLTIKESEELGKLLVGKVDSALAYVQAEGSGRIAEVDSPRLASLPDGLADVEEAAGGSAAAGAETND